MSTGRKIALTFSIVNCIAFIILFLWILPCDYDTCKTSHNVKTKDWEVNLTGKGILNNICKSLKVINCFCTHIN